MDFQFQGFLFHTIVSETIAWHWSSIDSPEHLYFQKISWWNSHWSVKSRTWKAQNRETTRRRKKWLWWMSRENVLCSCAWRIECRNENRAAWCAASWDHQACRSCSTWAREMIENNAIGGQRERVLVTSSRERCCLVNHNTRMLTCRHFGPRCKHIVEYNICIWWT